VTRTNWLALIVAATLVAACGADAEDKPAPAMSGAAGDAMKSGDAMMSGNGMMAAKGGANAPIEGDMPELTGAATWLNSKPLTRASLKGKVVVVDFWTYSCINCLRALPYVTRWYDHYKDAGLVVIGVHSPEFPFEKQLDNVQRAVKELKVTYPVALDNNYAIWQAFNNRYWPAHYFVDANGQIRGHHFGEGNYEESEQLIRELLEEAGQKNLPGRSGEISGAGVQAAPDENHVESPETYVGYERAENFVSSGGAAKDSAKTYEVPPKLLLNQWALGGNWTVNPQDAVLDAAGGRITFHFRARDLHLVLGPGAEGKPVRFRVTLDGHEPGADHGVDTDEHGRGTVTEQRLYQLIRQSGGVVHHTFTIEFLDAGARAYAFTFG
jgi:thiol-disulfide isomerase/thioredoxin